VSKQVWLACLLFIVQLVMVRGDDAVEPTGRNGSESRTRMMGRSSCSSRAAIESMVTVVTGGEVIVTPPHPAFQCNSVLECSSCSSRAAAVLMVTAVTDGEVIVTPPHLDPQCGEVYLVCSNCSSRVACQTGKEIEHLEKRKLQEQVTGAPHSNLRTAEALKISQEQVMGAPYSAQNGCYAAPLEGNQALVGK
jgi:hypothetical protein